MRRALPSLVPIAALFAALLAAGVSASAQAPNDRTKVRGEILGLNREERTITVRSDRIEGKDLHVFHVVEETIIRPKRSSNGKPSLSMDDLAPGDMVWVTARREAGRRIAIEIVVRQRGERGAP